MQGVPEGGGPSEIQGSGGGAPGNEETRASAAKHLRSTISNIARKSPNNLNTSQASQLPEVCRHTNHDHQIGRIGGPRDPQILNMV